MCGQATANFLGWKQTLLSNFTDAVTLKQQTFTSANQILDFFFSSKIIIITQEKILHTQNNFFGE